MNTVSSNVNFRAQQIPTEPLLKTALKLQSFEDAKSFIQSVHGIKISGKYGFHQRAMLFTSQILEKNPWLEEIVNNIKLKNPSKEKQISAISETVEKLGKNIDVEV